MNDRAVEVSIDRRKVALVGNPNVGKTTIFNLLTGLRQKVANYPGVTVERKSGKLLDAPAIDILDLPGTYSLSPKSLDERITCDVLYGRLDSESEPDVVVCIADASNLERNLFLATQVIDTGLPVILVLNMMDSAETAGLEIDVSALRKALGIPVVPMKASRGEGLETLKHLLTYPQLPPPASRGWTLMPAVDVRMPGLTAVLAEAAPDVPSKQHFGEALSALTNDAVLAYWERKAPAFHQAILEARASFTEAKVPYQQAEVMGRYSWLSPLVAQVVSRKKSRDSLTISDRIDAVVTHRIFGLLLFGLILMLIFQAVFTWATPAMDMIELGVVGLGDLVRAVMPTGWVADLLVDGVITGVGNVLVFLPQILLLFFFLGLMEDTGYMARSAFIMDRLMHRVGLSGGSVVPLLSSFACAIPGIMAARTLANQRDRLITIMVAPLMSCSARLPVYTLFIAAFLPTGYALGIFSYQGLAMFSMYLLGTVMAFVAAFVLKKFVFKGEASFFAMELPPYRLPRFKHILWRMVDRSKVFVYRAGKIIFGLSIVLWFLARFPSVEPDPTLVAERAAAEATYAAVLNDVAASVQVSTDDLTSNPDITDALTRLEAGESLSPTDSVAQAATAIFEAQTTRDAELEQLDAAEAAYRIEHSFIGIIGRSIEPVMQPLGFDWKISAGLIAAFAAREVIISALATIYSVGDADEESPLLREQLKADRYPNGEPVYTPLVAVSLLIFFVFALQCVSTLAIARRETNSWRWPAVMWLYMTGLAYLFSLIVYQGGLALGF